MNTEPTTLIEAVKHYADLNVCHKFMIEIKWPGGIVRCPKCGGTHVGEVKSRRLFQCKDKGCRKQFSTKVGTIFEDSPLGLDKWFVAVWCIANAKNGISSHELGRDLGVTQRTAWFMLHRIRVAMRTGTLQKIIGEVETDETFIGGAAKNMHAAKRKAKIQGRGTVGKIIVHGLLQRGGKVHVKVVKDQKRNTLQSEVRQHVTLGATAYSDSLKSYVGLNDEYTHQMVDHAVEYVRGRVHTNGMENFWSLLKRTIDGTYVSVAPAHLQRYLDEQSFRFNERKCNDRSRFRTMMRGTTGKRLTYRTLTAECLTQAD